MKMNKTSLKIIELFLIERKECYLREIAKKTNKSTSTTSRQLNLLKNDGILNEKRVGKELFYSLNLKNNSALKLCELVEIQKLESFYKRNSEMKIILEDFLNKIKDENLVSAAVFGSVANESYAKDSDIDLILITNKRKEFTEEIRNIHAEYGRDLSIVSMTKKEFREKKSEPLVREVIRNHLILYGYEHFVREVFVDEE